MYQAIILASGSPRRRELMARIGINFQYVTSTAKEIMSDTAPPGETAMKNAAMKAYSVARIYDNAFVIGADTVVIAPDGEMLGKPKSAEDVRRMLKKLSGQTHEVITGVAIANKREEVFSQFFESTKVTFKPFTDHFIDWYIDTEEPFDKAGSYGIQGKGCLMTTGIVGDYDNVVGLPVSKLFDHLMDMGVRPAGGLHAL